MTEAGPVAKEESIPASPQILLLDMPEDTVLAFRDRGYSTKVGSLGRPYRVKQTDNWTRVPDCTALPPGWAESDILIVDLRAKATENAGPFEHATSAGEMNLWVKCSYGVVDPRPYSALMIKDAIEEIYQHGGALIVFIDSEFSQDYMRARVVHRQFRDEQQVEAHPWSFLDLLHQQLQVRSSHGLILQPTELVQGSALQRYFENGEYGCTLDLDSRYDESRDVKELVESKFGETVGLATSSSKEEGVVFVLPQVTEKTELALELVKTSLPRIVPAIFPGHEESGWLRGKAYEHTEILEIEARKASLKEELESKLAAQNKRIAEIRAERLFWHELLTETGDKLKHAVLEAFKHLGCTGVVDADKILNADDPPALAEDVRLEDSSPLLLGEVKGILGGPRDEDALAAAKYIAPAMKRLRRTDIQAFAVINHERGRPPLQREAEPFRDEVVEAATSQDVALLTTWDLFLLCRGVEELGWVWRNLRPLFETPGRLSPVPAHYTEAGKVRHVWPESRALGIELATGEVRTDDRLAFRLPDRFVEIQVASLMEQDTPSERVNGPAEVGIQPKEWTEIRVGAVCFLVDPS